MNAGLFSLGRIVATPGAMEAFERNNQAPHKFLGRHLIGDWGELDEEDKNANDRAVRDGSRILSAYLLNDGTKFWIITEAVDDDGQRESSCILLPSEY